MKKQIHKKRTGVKLGKSNKSKFRRSYKAIQSIVKSEPGPSKLIKYNEDGKFIGITPITGNVKQSSYTTNTAKKAMEENKRIKQSKKDRVKEILKKAGYDNTIRYTREEKKRFTRIVKNKLFAKSDKTITLKPEIVKKETELKKRLDKKKVEKLMKATVYDRLPIQNGKQRGMIAREHCIKERPKLRKFRYTIDRKREGDPMRNYAFLTDYFEANTRSEALNKAKEIYKDKNYCKDTSFVGMTIHDMNGDGSMIYYSPKKLSA